MDRSASYVGRRVLKEYPFTKHTFIGQDDGYGLDGALVGLYGKAHDHNEASGGYKKDAVLLLRNIDKEAKDKVPSILNVTPSILELFGIAWNEKRLDGRSIF